MAQLAVAPFLIGNRHVAPRESKARELVDPSTAQAYAMVGVADRADVDRAVMAASDALDTWRTVPVDARRALVDAFADGIERHKAELVEIEVRQTGKLTREVEREIPGLVAQIRAFGTLAEAFEWEVRDEGRGVQLAWEPIGVVASLLPWNAPLNAAARRIAVTIATATTTVIKPSMLGPLSPLRLAEIACDAGVPAGVINVVTGPGERTGRALLAHPGISKGSFTGSVETGRDVLRRATRRLLPVAAELGGKAPQIVFADAPWELAQAGVLRGFTRNAGQICTSGTRLLVHASIADRFVDELVTRAAAMRVGPASDPASDMGPQISAAHRVSIDGFVQRARAAGRTVATGGHVVPGDGFFYRPTVVTGVDAADELFQEEVFGPVLAVTRFETVDEAVGLANGTAYGFVAGIWTGDHELGVRVARRVEAGACWINAYWANRPDLSNVPRRNSGAGAPDSGIEGLREYLTPKQVAIA
jgi:acyl-CoA reductase-like NAD-dependent aldehyde dehydrogenase